MRIVDLRTLTSKALEPLFAQEQAHWLEELSWDYRPSIQLIAKFLDAHSLAGCAAMDGNEPAGYGFYVMEEGKALVGGLFVAPQHSGTPMAQRLLEKLLAQVRQAQGVERIEAQLMPFGAPLDAIFAAAGFSLHQRNFMVLRLAETHAEGAPLADGLRIEPWHDGWFEPCASLIYRAYAGHVDADINDQYRSYAGALRFLKNIVVLPGCGVFQPRASFVVRRAPTDATAQAGGAIDSELVGVALASCVSHAVGHTTQICVLPEYRGHAIGRRLMAASIGALRSAGFQALSLTVTAENTRAVRLYEQIGFRTIKTFSAAVWQA